MKLNKAGRELIKEFEGWSAKAYPDPGSGGDPWTIGWGRTRGVRPGDTTTQALEEAHFQEDIATFVSGVRNLVIRETTPNQFAAMVSLAYNVGLANFRRSSVLRAHNRADYAAAAGAFKLWNKASGRVLNGLVRRRAAEASLYMKPEIIGAAVETRATPDIEKPVVKRKTVVATAGIAAAGVGQQVVENLPAIQSAHTTVSALGGFEWVVKLLGLLIVLAALFVLLEQWRKRRKGEA